MKDPYTMAPYTEDQAWNYIADCIAAGVDVHLKEKTDEHPDDAYELCASPDGHGRQIYMKVVLRREIKKIIGVSFHYEQLA